MDRMDHLHAFDLDNNEVLNEEIDPIAEFELFPFVHDGQSELRLDSISTSPQFFRKACFVSAFKKAGPEQGVDFDCGADYCSGDLVDSRCGDRCWSSHTRSLAPSLGLDRDFERWLL